MVIELHTDFSHTHWPFKQIRNLICPNMFCSLFFFSSAAIHLESQLLAKYLSWPPELPCSPSADSCLWPTHNTALLRVTCPLSFITALLHLGMQSKCKYRFCYSYLNIFLMVKLFCKAVGKSRLKY